MFSTGKNGWCQNETTSRASVTTIFQTPCSIGGYIQIGGKMETVELGGVECAPKGANNPENSFWQSIWGGWG